MIRITKNTFGLSRQAWGGVWSDVPPGAVRLLIGQLPRQPPDDCPLSVPRLPQLTALHVFVEAFAWSATRPMD